MYTIQAQSKARYQHGRAQHTDVAHGEMLHGKERERERCSTGSYALQLAPAGFLLAEFISSQSSAERSTLPQLSAWHGRCLLLPGMKPRVKEGGGWRGGQRRHILISSRNHRARGKASIRSRGFVTLPQIRKASTWDCCLTQNFILKSFYRTRQ